MASGYRIKSVTWDPVTHQLTIIEQDPCCEERRHLVTIPAIDGGDGIGEGTTLTIEDQTGDITLQDVQGNVTIIDGQDLCTAIDNSCANLGCCNLVAGSGFDPETSLLTLAQTNGDTLVFDLSTLAGGGGGEVPASRLLTAGDGLGGGGDLSADRTFFVLPDVTTGGDTAPVSATGNGTGVDVTILDGDHLTIDWSPSFYTPLAAPLEADDVDDLTAHLAGIDFQLSDLQDQITVLSVTIGGGGGGGSGSLLASWESVAELADRTVTGIQAGYRSYVRSCRLTFVWNGSAYVTDGLWSYANSTQWSAMYELRENQLVHVTNHKSGFQWTSADGWTQVYGPIGTPDPTTITASGFIGTGDPALLTADGTDSVPAEGESLTLFTWLFTLDDQSGRTIEVSGAPGLTPTVTDSATLISSVEPGGTSELFALDAVAGVIWGDITWTLTVEDSGANSDTLA